MGTPTPATAPTSTYEKMTSAVGTGAKKVTSWVTPQPKVVPAKDPIALENSPAKMGPDIFVSLARIHESKGNYAAAAAQYQKALDTDPKDLAALLGYAHLYDRQNKLNEATAYYERAVQLHPKSATAHNDIGLCYARRGMHEQAAQSLRQAIALDATRPLYRNNLATVLVELGRPDEALREFQLVNDPATAHYNVAYLLQQKGQNQLAIRHFAEASRLNPQLTAAQTWLAKLSPQTAQPVVTTPPAYSPQRQPVRQPINAQPVSATVDRMQPPARGDGAGADSRYDEPVMRQAAPDVPSRWQSEPARGGSVRLPSTISAPVLDAPGPPISGGR
jgi:Tfp pilus assembly protein PilF